MKHVLFFIFFQNIGTQMTKMNLNIFNAFGKKNKWSLFELYVICEKIDDRDELFNPNLFFGKQLFYIEHVKTCLLLDF